MDKGILIVLDDTREKMMMGDNADANQNDIIPCIYMKRSNITLCTPTDLDYNLADDWNLLIVDMNKEKIDSGEYGMIIKIRCRTKAPILVLLDKCNAKDKLVLYSLGVTEYMEYPIYESEFQKSIDTLMEFSGYYKKFY